MNLQTDHKSPLNRPPSRRAEIFYPEADGEPIAETGAHRSLLAELIRQLEIFFAAREGVYVSSSIMFYYAEGEPSEVVSPDVMVCFGIPKGERTSYKIWEENDVVPSVVIELSSRGTWKKDRLEKRLLYEMLGVKEYFIFNPLDLKSATSFSAFCLKNGEYESAKIENQRIVSEVLGLELIVKEKSLRLFNPANSDFLPTSEELAEAVSVLGEQNDELKAEIERLKKLLENK